MTAERKPGEREKCHKIYCPNQPAWIPAGQNGCPHCGGTATRGFCICETASADEIRDMYTPPAPESEPEREWKVGDEAITRGRFRAKNERVRVELIGKDNIPGDWRVRPVGGGVWYLVRESELSPAPSETPHDDGCGGCDLGICTPSETPSPEVGMREEAHRLLDAWLDSDGAMAWNTVQRAACDARDALLAAAKETK